MQEPHAPDQATDTGTGQPVRPAPSAPAARPPARQPGAPSGKKQRAARYAIWFLSGLFTVVALALGGLWFWSSTDESLNALLGLIQRHMPAGSSLHAEGVSGSIRRGGHIRKLTYRLQDAQDTTQQAAPNAPARPPSDHATGSLTVTLEDTDITWNWAALRHRATQLHKLHIRTLTLEDTRTAKPGAEPPKPPNALALPMGIDAPFVIDTLTLALPASKPQTIHALQGRYRYDLPNARHHLDIGTLRYQQGAYSLQATLGAAAPMPLQFKADAEFRFAARQDAAHASSAAAAASSPLPTAQTASAQAPEQAMRALRASLTGEGHLAGANAKVRLHAKVQPKNEMVDRITVDRASAAASGSPPSAQTEADAVTDVAEPRLELHAAIQPWQRQMLAGAQAQWQYIDLHAFLPQAPHTLLQGTLQLQPQPAEPRTDTPSPRKDAAADPLAQALGFLGDTPWHASLHASNIESGPLDQQRLPLHALTGKLRYHDGQLHLQAFDWQPAAKGGRISGEGTYHGTREWNSQWQLHALDPATIHSALQAAPLQGRLEARSEQATHKQSAPAAPPTAMPTQPVQGWIKEPVAFTADIQSVAKRENEQLHFDAIQIQGQWHGQMARLSRILLRSRGGMLQGQASYHAGKQTAAADLALQLPGSTGLLTGQLAPDSGQGQMRLDMRNLHQTSQWLRPWPGMQFLRTNALDGSALLHANWRGGWRNNGQNMQLNTRLQAPLVTIRRHGSAAAPVTLRNTNLTLQGRLAQAQLLANGQMQQGARSLQVALQGHGGKRGNGWHAQLQAMQAQLRDTFQKQQWQADLVSPVPVAIEQDNTRLQLRTGAFQIRLRGHVASAQEAYIRGEPLRWLQHGNSHQISSKGNIRGLPLAWLQALSGSATIDQTLTGDMQFDGAWDVDLGQRLQLRASLARSSGDIVILAGSGQGRIAAGTRTARLDVQGTGNHVEARLAWDSARAGSADVQLRTRLQRGASGWTLPGSAPVQGKLQAKLPRVGIWNMFAPPGWRLRGSFDANIGLSGTLHTPLLHGTLQMDDLGVRSIVDGIAFSNGRLRARLSGQRMEIDEFSLQGSPSRTGLLGAQRIGGGSLNITGYTQWGGSSSLQESVRVQLDGKLDQLQLFTLPDRLIVLSGNLHAGFSGMQLRLRGGLRVNRALIELPESSAPKLDDDVQILPSSKYPKAILAQPAQKSSANAPQTARGAPQLGDDVVVLAPSGQPGRATTATRRNAPGASAATQSAAAVARATAQSANTPRQTAARAASRATTTGPNPRIGADIHVGIDLGNNFRVRGRGLDTRINGQLAVTGGPAINATPRITGVLNTDRGTFRAYGQDLQIERGRITFNGAADNPALDITALRSNLDIRVGVRIYGRAQQPIVQLFSEPSMPDSERLSWLVLGRSSYSAADAALLQQAAMALLGGDGRGITGQLADALGLDDVNFKGGDTLENSSVTLGKRFSKNFYVAYEKGLDATMGTLYFFLDLNRSLKLRVQTGQQSALDLIYTVNYD